MKKLASLLLTINGLVPTYGNSPEPTAPLALTTNTMQNVYITLRLNLMPYYTYYDYSCLDTVKGYV